MKNVKEIAGALVPYDFGEVDNIHNEVETLRSVVAVLLKLLVEEDVMTQLALDELPSEVKKNLNRMKSKFRS